MGQIRFLSDSALFRFTLTGIVMKSSFLFSSFLVALLAVGLSTPALSQTAVSPLLSQQPVEPPLEVYIEPGDQLYDWYIHTNKAAYIAAFHIFPESGAIVLSYPNDHQKEHRVKAGEVAVWNAPRTWRIYNTNKSSPYSRLLRRNYRGFETRQHRYILVIASPEPLAYSPLEERPSEFRDRLTVTSFSVEDYVKHITEQMVAEGQVYQSTMLMY